jgi:hypothetical protein
MVWLVLSYTLPAQARSSPRVTVWRRLKQIGALALAGGAQVLPARDECEEAFQWLAQEIRAAQGEAVIMRVEQFTGSPDAELISQFQAARADDYAELEPEVKRLEQALRGKDRFRLQEALERLRRKHTALAEVDYFDSPAGAQIAARLGQIEQALVPASRAQPVRAAAVGEYRDKRWVTRPRPHVDRLACAWLVRRYINPEAHIRYSLQSEPGEVAFDMEPADFGHQGDQCSFESMLAAFSLEEPGLRALADIVHDIDLHENRYGRPETHGVMAIMNGWRLANLTDEELEARGLALFEGLYLSLSAGAAPAQPRAKKRR